MKMHRWLGAGAALLAVLAAPAVHADQAAFAVKAKALSGLVGYWAFEGNYDDSSGKGNNAAAKGVAANIGFCPGVKGGQALQFQNNTNDNAGYVSVPAPVGSVFDSPQFTALVWSNIASASEADHWDNVFDRTSLWYIETQWKEAEDGTMQLDLVNRIYDPENPNNGGTDQVRSLQADTPFSLKGKTWHLIGFSYDGKVIISYVDGKEVIRKEYDGGIGPTAATPTDPPKSNYDLNWGLWDQVEDAANGCFDDTVVYNRALTPDEVKSLFDAIML
jgi:hypothetical protein